MVARRRLLLAVLIGLLALVSTTTTIANSATLVYDTPALTRVDVNTNEAGGLGRALVSDTQAGRVPPAVGVRGTSTTPIPGVVATNKAFASVDDLTGSTLSNYNRFVKNLPAAAETPTIRNLADGAVEFSAKVPATNIPGSYATYTKVVSSDGVTTSFIKTTIAPDGSVVSVKVKFP